jgi:hypothetical protein
VNLDSIASREEDLQGPFFIVGSIKKNIFLKFLSSMLGVIFAFCGIVNSLVAIKVDPVFSSREFTIISISMACRRTSVRFVGDSAYMLPLS